MTVLSDVDLVRAISFGDLTIEPYRPELIGPASIDLVLGGQFRFFDAELPFIDPAAETEATELVTVGEGGVLTLQPGEFVLGCTKQVVTLSAAVVARLEGKSSLGRLGIMIHSTAGFIDPGFRGQITLELSNVAPVPVSLYVGMRIAQLSVERLSCPAEVPYGVRHDSKYHEQHGPTASRSYHQWRLW